MTSPVRRFGFLFGSTCCRYFSAVVSVRVASITPLLICEMMIDDLAFLYLHSVEKMLQMKAFVVLQLN